MSPDPDFQANETFFASCLFVCLFGTWRHRHWHLACQTCLNIGRIRTLELRAVEKTASCISFQLLAS